MPRRGAFSALEFVAMPSVGRRGGALDTSTRPFRTATLAPARVRRNGAAGKASAAKSAASRTSSLANSTGPSRPCAVTQRPRRRRAISSGSSANRAASMATPDLSAVTSSAATPVRHRLQSRVGTGKTTGEAGEAARIEALLRQSGSERPQARTCETGIEIGGVARIGDVGGIKRRHQARLRQTEKGAQKNEFTPCRLGAHCREAGKARAPRHAEQHGLGLVVAGMGQSKRRRADPIRLGREQPIARVPRRLLQAAIGLFRPASEACDEARSIERPDAPHRPPPRLPRASIHDRPSPQTAAVHPGTAPASGRRDGAARWNQARRKQQGERPGGRQSWKRGHRVRCRRPPSGSRETGLRNPPPSVSATDALLLALDGLPDGGGGARIFPVHLLEGGTGRLLLAEAGK